MAVNTNGLFSLEINVNKFFLPHVKCLLPSIAIRFLDLPTVFINFVNHKFVKNIKETLSNYHIEMLPNQLKELQDHEGNFIVNQGKSCLFKSSIEKLRNKLTFTPLYLLIIDHFQENSRYVANSSVALNEIMDLVYNDVIMKHQETTNRSEKQLCKLYNLMGLEMGYIIIEYGLYYFGETIYTHLHKNYLQCDQNCDFIKKESNDIKALIERNDSNAANTKVKSFDKPFKIHTECQTLISKNTQTDNFVHNYTQEPIDTDKSNLSSGDISSKPPSLIFTNVGCKTPWIRRNSLTSDHKDSLSISSDSANSGREYLDVSRNETVTENATNTSSLVKQQENEPTIPHNGLKYVLDVTKPMHNFPFLSHIIDEFDEIKNVLTEIKLLNVDNEKDSISKPLLHLIKNRKVNFSRRNKTTFTSVSKVNSKDAPISEKVSFYHKNTVKKPPNPKLKLRFGMTNSFRLRLEKSNKSHAPVDYAKSSFNTNWSRYKRNNNSRKLMNYVNNSDNFKDFYNASPKQKHANVLHKNVFQGFDKNQKVLTVNNSENMKTKNVFRSLNGVLEDQFNSDVSINKEQTNCTGHQNMTHIDEDNDDRNNGMMLGDDNVEIYNEKVSICKDNTDDNILRERVSPFKEESLIGENVALEYISKSSINYSGDILDNFQTRGFSLSPCNDAINQRLSVSEEFDGAVIGQSIDKLESSHDMEKQESLKVAVLLSDNSSSNEFIYDENTQIDIPVSISNIQTSQLVDSFDADIASTQTLLRAPIPNPIMSKGSPLTSARCSFNFEGEINAETKTDSCDSPDVQRRSSRPKLEKLRDTIHTESLSTYEPSDIAGISSSSYESYSEDFHRDLHADKKEDSIINDDIDGDLNSLFTDCVYIPSTKLGYTIN